MSLGSMKGTKERYYAMKRCGVIATICILVCAMSGCFFKPSTINLTGNTGQTGTANYPDDTVIEQYAMDTVCGENIERSDPVLHRYRSLDRDLEFGVDYTPMTSSLDGSFAHTTGGYFMSSDYFPAVHYFWQKEYEKAVDSHTFSYCYYHGCTGDNLYYAGTGLQVYMDTDVTEAQIAELEELLRQLRDICVKELAYHTSEPDFYYLVDFNLVDPDTLLITNCNTVKITANTTDEELRVSEFGGLSPNGYEGPPKRIENGDAFICMYGSGRSEEWEFYY